MYQQQFRLPVTERGRDCGAFKSVLDIWGIRTFGNLQQNQQKHGDEEQ